MAYNNYVLIECQSSMSMLLVTRLYLNVCRTLGAITRTQSVGGHKTIPSSRKILSIVFVVLLTMLLDGHSVNSSVTCYTFYRFVTILFRNL